ncbi:uncharacterized protein [Montipora capricornis]|uniref:uncharacterized protein isoform X2 n=1 Tax=Montipora capricornis TaxID=246305 RepID=UPI0035F19F3C
MANRSGSSWSLFGEGEVYREDVDPFKAIYGVRKEEFKGIYQTKGMACSVYVKKDEKQVAHFVTWSGVTRDLLNKPAQVNRFSSQHFGKYSASVDSNSTVETFGHFSFLPAGTIFAKLPSDKVFVVAFKPFEQEEDLEAYYFVGSEKRTLKLDTKTHKLVTSEKDKQKLELSSVLGAPIIVKKKNISPRESGRWCVVGVLGLSREGELCPHFVTNELFGQPGPSDAVQPPISQTPENSTNPPGGEAVDASGLLGPSDAVQPPISQTPENSSNPPGGEAVDGSGMDANEIRPNSKPAVTSREEHSLHEFGDTLIKLLISVSDLNEEQEKEVYNLLETQVKRFVKSRDYSSNKQKGVSALTDFIHKAYEVSLMAVNVGSLEIIVECPTLKSLEHLWNDYLSGHLNNVAERYLVTDEMKKKVGLETINLKTTINEEDYLACRKFFAKMTGEADVDLLSSQQGLLNQGSSTSEINTSADYTAVKEQDTSCAMRMEKAKVSRSALHRASINGQYEEVNTHLKNGANVDERDQFLLTPLHLACWYGHESVVKLLLDHNADVNALDRFQFTPLQKAERCNHQSIIQLLLDHDAKPSLQQPLSLRTSSKRALLRTDSHSGFNLLQAAVLQGDYDSVYKASNYIENFVEEMKSQRISNNASIFRGKSAVDILSALDCRKPGHADIEKLYQRLVKIDETLNELHSCAKSGD